MIYRESTNALRFVGAFCIRHGDPQPASAARAQAQRWFGGRSCDSCGSTPPDEESPHHEPEGTPRQFDERGTSRASRGGYRPWLAAVS